MRIYWLLAAIVLLTYSVYYGTRYLTLPAPAKILGAEIMPLSKSTQIATSDDLSKLWANVSGATLCFYINPQIKDRTANLYVSDSYAMAVDIGGNQSLKVLLTPDAGRHNMSAPIILEIYTQNQDLPETVDVPGVYLQRWSCVMIVKQGRKFNIYVNGKLAASHTCLFMPFYDTAQTIRVGDPGANNVKTRLGGNIALVNLFPYAMRLDDVRAYVSNTMGTDGKPYLSSDLPQLPDFSWGAFINLFACPGGNCDTMKKASPMDIWNSEYA